MQNSKNKESRNFFRGNSFTKNYKKSIMKRKRMYLKRERRNLQK